MKKTLSKKMPILHEETALKRYKSDTNVSRDDFFHKLEGKIISLTGYSENIWVPVNKNGDIQPLKTYEPAQESPKTVTFEKSGALKKYTPEFGFFTPIPVAISCPGTIRALADEKNTTLPKNFSIHPARKIFSLEHQKQAQMGALDVADVLRLDNIRVIEADLIEAPPFGYLKILKNNTVKQLSNFTISEISVVKLINELGEVTEAMNIVLQTTASEHKITVSKEEFLSKTAEIIEKNHPDCFLSTDSLPNAKENFRRVLSFKYRSRRQVQNLFSYSGWSPKNKQGNRIYLHGNLENCRSENKLPHLPQTPNIAELTQALEILKVASPEVIAPLLLYQMFSFLAQPFEDAKSPVKFSMMAIGPTGSGKTSLFREIFGPFLKDGFHSLRDTTASFRAGVKNCLDNVLIVDDFLQEGSNAKIREKQERLWELIRAYSDSTFYEKWKSDTEKTRTLVRGGCVFTAEEVPDNERQSAALRSVRINFKKIDFKVLSSFQKNPAIMRNFYAQFIKYIERNYGAITALITDYMGVLRNKIPFPDRRMADSAAALIVTSRIFTDFMESLGIWDPETSAKWSDNVSNIIIKTISENEDAAKNYNPISILAMALLDLRGEGKIYLAENIDSFIEDRNHFLGYAIENHVVMLKANALFSLVQSYARNRSLNLSCGELELWKKLKAEKISICNAGSNLRKTPTKIPGRPRMLCLNMTAVAEFLKVQDGISYDPSDLIF